jgi:non-ribosomal peptide synthetase component F
MVQDVCIAQRLDTSAKDYELKIERCRIELVEIAESLSK